MMEPLIANEPALPPAPVAPDPAYGPEDASATPWLIVLLAVALLLALFIIAALVAARPA